MGRILAGFVFALALTASVWSTAASAEQACTTPVANPSNPGCGDAYRGMVLYGQVPAPGIPYTWSCNQCHSANPLTDKLDTPAPAPSLIRAAPRDPGYIQFMMYKQPEAAPIMFAMEACCIADRPPDNVWGDLGDIAEFLYTCKMGIAPCVTGGGGSPGELSGSGTKAFGNQLIGSTSAPLTLTLTNIGAATVNVSAVASDNAAEFAITANTCTTLSPATSCTVKVTFHPTAAGPRSGGIIVTSNGLYSPQKFTFTGSGSVANHTGIWWNASESGWGVNFQHDGTKIFATWFIYDGAGKPWWIVMTGDPDGNNTFTGTLWKTTGSGYDAASFTAGTAIPAGTGTITFADANNATLTYNVTGMGTVTRSITPQPFGTQPTCTYSAVADLAGAKNYQGLWWNAGESGWGINFAHHDNTLFATWYTFDVDTSPTWFVSIMTKGGGETFTGKLLRMTATPFGVVPFAANPYVEAGDASLVFTNGNSAAFGYTIGAVSKTKLLTRQPLGAPSAGTVCK